MTCILTLAVDPASQAQFEQLRQQNFPPHRNLIPAHVTLFHTLPDSDSLRELLSAACRDVDPFPVRVTGLQFLGRGVAYQLASPELAALRGRLADTFSDFLSAQDRQPFRPHIVVQNKVDPAVARDLHARLAEEFTPMEIRAEALDLWEYMGGPWRAIKTFRFRRSDPASV